MRWQNTRSNLINLVVGFGLMLDALVLGILPQGWYLLALVPPGIFFAIAGWQLKSLPGRMAVFFSVGVVFLFVIGTRESGLIDHNISVALSIFAVGLLASIYFLAKMTEILQHLVRPALSNAREKPVPSSAVATPTLESTMALSDPAQTVREEIPSAKSSEPSIPATRAPWEQIEETGRDRQVLEYWWQGLTAAMIGRKVGGISAKTVHNILSSLRAKYGEELVPAEKDRRRLGLYTEE